MVRKILARAKTKNEDKWIYGFPQPTNHMQGDSGKCFIGQYVRPTQIVPTLHICDEKTLSFYTFLTDSDGNKIFEHDLVKDEHGNIYEAFWRESYYQFSFRCVKSKHNLFIGKTFDLWSLANKENFYVVGNIFDNPDVLED